jgi:hypothetical protein
MRISSTIRAFAALPLLAAVLSAAPSKPGFVDSLEPSNRAEIARVVEGTEADLVVLSAGWLEGFRTGMACVVSDGSARTGEILLVEVRLNHAVGLIVNRPEDAGIDPGNLVTVKTFTVSS